MKPRRSGPESNSTSSTSLPMSRLKIDRPALPSTGKLKPAFADCCMGPCSCAAFAALPLSHVLAPWSSAANRSSVAGAMSVISESATSGEFCVVSALSPATEKPPMGMCSSPRQSGRAETTLVISTTRSMNCVVLFPPSVLNFLAIVIRFTSPPPADRLRSESTGMGA